MRNLSQGSNGRASGSLRRSSWSLPDILRSTRISIFPLYAIGTFSGSKHTNKTNIRVPNKAKSVTPAKYNLHGHGNALRKEITLVGLQLCAERKSNKESTEIALECATFLPPRLRTPAHAIPYRGV